MLDDFFDHVIHVGPEPDDSMLEIAKDITPDVTMQANLVYIAEGNVGAMTAMRMMFESDEDRAAYSLGFCAAWGITGPMLWLLFKDVNNQDAAKMMEMIVADEARTALESLPYAHYQRKGA